MTGLEDLPDDALAARGREGDADAMAALFQRHAETLRRYATRWMPPLVRRKVSVADMLQETRIVAVQTGAAFEHWGESSVRNWLLKILQNKVRETIRNHAGTAKRDVNREITQGADPPPQPDGHVGPTPSEGAMAADLAGMVEESLAELPPHYEQVLRMARFDGLSSGAIAECLGTTREATKKTYARALTRFTDVFDRRRKAHDG